MEQNVPCGQTNYLIMKTIRYFFAAATAAACIASCQTPELKTENIERYFSSALYDGSADSLHIEIELEWPVRGLPPVAMQNLQNNLTSSIFGKESASTSIETSISAYTSKQEEEYRKNVNDLRSIFEAESMDGGRYSWSEILEGSFLEPYENMQSFLLYIYGYTGGAHGIDSETGYTFRLSDGKRIQEADLFKSGYKPELGKILTEMLPKSVSKDVYDMLFIKAIEPNGNFYVEPEGVTYIYGRYEIGPYASGLARVTIPWDRLKGILK